jgi:hypothetical protein
MLLGRSGTITAAIRLHASRVLHRRFPETREINWFFHRLRCCSCWPWRRDSPGYSHFNGLLSGMVTADHINRSTQGIPVIPERISTTAPLYSVGFHGATLVAMFYSIHPAVAGILVRDPPVPFQ